MKLAIASIVIVLISQTYALGSGQQPRTVSVYKKHIQSDEHTKAGFDHVMHHMLYLSGVADALMIINQQRIQEKRQPFFCLPENPALNGSDYIRILETHLFDDETPIPEDILVAEALLIALKNEYPCN